MRCLMVMLACALGAAVLAGCGGKALTREELDCARDQYVENAAMRREEMIRKVVRRMARDTEDYAKGLTTEEPTFDVLVISGGSDRGAFGAGFLAAWGTVPPGPMARPEFDVVTGVSTGALIAPFLFCDACGGPARVSELYQNPPGDWIGLNGLFFLFEDSVFSSSGLMRDVKRSIGKGMIEGMARESCRDRLLAIGTTNVDLGVSHTWDLGAEAERAVTTGDRSRIYSILQASSAVPGAFPPVKIDGGMHVDGGASSNILVVGDLLAPDSPRKLFAMAYPERKLPKIRYWVILNYQTGPVPSPQSGFWLDITVKGVDALIRSSTVTALRYFAQQVEHIKAVEHADIELRYVSIPRDWRPGRRVLFDKDNMRSLAQLGMVMGADPEGKAWRTDLAHTPTPAMREAQPSHRGGAEEAEKAE